LKTESYDETYMAALISGARSKMGLFEELDGDKELYESLLTAMLESGTNYKRHFLRRFTAVELWFFFDNLKKRRFGNKISRVKRV